MRRLTRLRLLLCISLTLLLLGSIAAIPTSAKQELVFRTITWSSYLNKMQLVNPLAPNFFWDAAVLVYSWLAFYDYKNSRLIPDLATDWKWINDTVLRIHIRRGVVWSDGTPFTAWDVWAQIIIISRWGWFEYSGIKTAIVVDNYTVDIVFKKRTIFDEYFVLHAFPMWMPCKYWCSFAREIVEAEKTGNKTRVQMVLTKAYSFKPKKVLANGPYLPVSATESVFELRKNPMYWNKTALKYMPDKIYIISAGSNERVWMMLKAGSIDYANVVIPPAVEKSLLSTGFIEIVKVPHSGLALYFNFENKWLRIPQVRQAIACIINRSLIAYSAYGNIYVPVKIPDGLHDWMRRIWLNSSVISMENAYTCNPKEAEKLLESVGFKKIGGRWYTPDGKLWTLRIRAPSGWTDWTSAMEAVMIALSNFGISVDYRPVELGTFWNVVWNQKQFDIAPNWWGCWHINHPYWAFYQWVSRFRSLGFPTKFYIKGIGWVDAAKLLDQLLHAKSLEEQRKIVALLALVTNKALPIYVIAEKEIPQIVSTKNYVWPSPDSWVWWIKYHAEFVSTVFQLGLAKPKHLATSTPSSSTATTATTTSTVSTASSVPTPTSAYTTPRAGATGIGGSTVIGIAIAIAICIIAAAILVKRRAS